MDKNKSLKGKVRVETGTKKHGYKPSSESRFMELAVVMLAFFMIVSIGSNIGLWLEMRKIQESNKTTIGQLQEELEYQNNVDYALRNDYADVQAQVDLHELYMWQFGTERISKAQFAAKIEDNPGRSLLLNIKKHKLPWEKQLR